MQWGGLGLGTAKRGEWCIVCQEDNPNILEFDHINAEGKEIALARMTSHNNERFEVERAKTQILYVTCHRRAPRARGWLVKCAQRNKAHIRMRKLEIGQCTICQRRPDGSHDPEIGLALTSTTSTQHENRER